MEHSELVDFVNKNKENFSIQLKRKNLQLYNKIDRLYTFDKFGQKLYHYLNVNADVESKCEICENMCKFDSFHKGYRKRCSYKCMGVDKSKSANECRKCIICDVDFICYIKQDKKTCSVKCSRTLNFSDENNRKRSATLKSSLIEKYGVDHPLKIPGIYKKIKSTKLERYGDEHYVNNEKSKKTKFERYGDENYVNLDKFKQTCIVKYGVDNPSKLEDIKNKVNISKKEKFGDVMISQEHLDILHKNLQDKKCGFGSTSSINGMVKKYGVPNATMNKDILQKLITSQHDKFYDSLINGTRLDNKFIPMFSRDEYIGTREKDGKSIYYKFKCVSCNNIFSGSLDDGGFPRCNVCMPITRSKYELEVYEYIKTLISNTDELVTNTRKIIPPLELDIYIPSKNVAVEINGIIWHSEILGNKNKNYHLNKTIECNNKGIRLIHIFENEWVNKQHIVKNKLRHILCDSSSNKSIYARKCILKELSTSECTYFLNQYHLQGAGNSSVRIGAYYENKLVSVMTFGKKRLALGTKQNEEGSYEMYRFCLSDVPVVGIASRLFTYFIKTYNPKNIVTFADMRYSGMSAFYEKIGFKFVSHTTPNYYYFNTKDPYTLKHRFNFRKQELHKKLDTFDETLTEWQNMQLNKYDRIWDCGHIKYEWNAT